MTSKAVEAARALDADRISRAWRAFQAYRALSLQVFDLQAHSFSQLSPSSQALLPTVAERLSHAAEAVEHNADILERIGALAGLPDGSQNTDRATADGDQDDQTPPEALEQTVVDFPDVVDTLLAISRDWSTMGASDRQTVHARVVRAVSEAADDAVDASVVGTRSEFTVLVVGASLGRLTWELARCGLSVQGVESSYLNLFACNFILNGTATPEDPLHIYPFVHHTGMVASLEDQLSEVRFPDADPKGLTDGDLSMVAGEFLDLYDEAGSWDAVVTCFSLENSHSIISCVRRIAKILKIGGVWVNLGCLDFRFDDSESEPSVEVTSDELDLVIARCGLRVISRESLRCRPPFVVVGMVTEEYDSMFTTAVRV